MPKSVAEPTRNIALARALGGDARPRYIVAAEARVNPRRLTEIVEGREEPSAEVRTRIAAVLGCAESDLFPGG